MRATNKIIWTLILVCILLLILVTGQSNVRNFEKVQSSIETIYKDRLVVKGLIFELSSLLHQKEIAIISGNQILYKKTNGSINAEIAKILQNTVGFTVELEADANSNAMDIYINYGDSRRVIECASGMEKMMASLAIRVALINISSSMFFSLASSFMFSKTSMVIGFFKIR